MAQPSPHLCLSALLRWSSWTSSSNSALRVTKPVTEGLRCWSDRNFLLTMSTATKGRLNSTRHAGQPDVECLGWKQNMMMHRSKPRSSISRSNWAVRSDTPWFFPSLVSSNERVRCQSRAISGRSWPVRVSTSPLTGSLPLTRHQKLRGTDWCKQWSSKLESEKNLHECDKWEMRGLVMNTLPHWSQLAQCM